MQIQTHKKILKRNIKALGHFLIVIGKNRYMKVKIKLLTLKINLKI